MKRSSADWPHPARFDAFTHKATSQYSLAFEKASIIFNIAAVLSCYAARQNRAEESAIKVAYHSLQASAGMFTYINENFLHAPSSDLSRETVQCLINLMLAQAQEVFLEKQVADQKKVGLLAKLAAQAGYLYKETLDGIQENVNKAIFDKGWLMLAQVRPPPSPTPPIPVAPLVAWCPLNDGIGQIQLVEFVRPVLPSSRRR